MMIDKEIAAAFCEESLGLINQLDTILESLEKDPKLHGKLEEFGQVIDRIMGAAKTLDLAEISTFCELGKTIGYKSGQINEPQIINVVVAILFDTTFLLRKMLDQVETGNKNVLATISTKAFVSRLKWLSQKFSHIERSSVKIGPDSSSSHPTKSQNKKEESAQAQIDQLLTELGL